jgi:hypothetical protein
VTVIVAVDTNIFHGDPRMRRSHFRILLGQHLRGQITLALPEVVVRELPKLFQAQLDAATTTITREAGKLRDLGHDPGTIALPQSEKARADFEKRFRAELKDRGVHVAPVTGTLDDLLDRSVAERRPFRGNSQGFRDALIWRCILELAEEDEIVLITKNWKDFAQDDKHPDVLHQHLREDLQLAGHPPERVRLVASLEDFIKEHVPSAKELALAQHRFETDVDWREELTERVYNALHALDFDWWDRVTVVLTQSADVEDIAVEDVDLGRVTIVNAYETDDEDMVAVEIRADATLWFSFTTDIISAEWLVDEHADVELDQAAETLFQGRTMGRPVIVIYRADFGVTTGELGELEKVVAVDADDQSSLL